MTTPSSPNVDQFLHDLLSTFDESDLAHTGSPGLDPLNEIANAIRTAWPHGRPPTVDELGGTHDPLAVHVGDPSIDHEINHYPWQHSDHGTDSPQHHDDASHPLDFGHHDHGLDDHSTWI
jgi:hypothetical protein